MTPAVEKQFLRNLAAAPIHTAPYPHIYVPEIFPAEFYAELQRNIPDPQAMLPIGEARPVKGYDKRFVLDPNGPMDGLTETQTAFWRSLSETLMSGRLRDQLAAKFAAYLKQRFKGWSEVELYDETLLVQDITKYSLGPHTDTPSKVITVLFYLPPDTSQAHMGTSIYTPKDPTSYCSGGPHYGFEQFDLFATMPFVPNAMFAFVKTNQSFHGVEPVTDPDVRRWLLLYDIRVRPLKPQSPVAQS